MDNLRQLFVGSLNLAVAASWLIVVLLLLRPLLKRLAPKWVLCALWALVAVRLVCPVALQSDLSVYRLAGDAVQSSGQVTYFQDTGFCGDVRYRPATLLPGVSAETPSTPDSTVPDATTAADAIPQPQTPARSVDMNLPSILWAVGIYVMLMLALAGYLSLREDVAASIPLEGNVYLCDSIKSPFILGMFRPCIYLTSGMDEAARVCVLRHERAHLRRGDHLWKPLGFLLLAVYWYNPLVWAAYILFCRDMELACDERVVRDMTREDRAAYSQALLQCSLNRRRRLVLCPLAFGEVGVRTRVKSVLRYRRPAVWLSAAAVLLCAALAVTFLTEPKTAENAPAEKARTHNNDYVDYFQRIQKKEAQQGRSVDNPVVIISTSMEPATSQISYQVQLLDGMTDWEKERILSRYSMNIANMEVFYPQEGDIYQEMDVPHLRFRAVSSTSVPPIDPAYDDLVALDNPYEPYTLASVTVLSANGSQSSTFRRVGQSLLLDDAPDDSGRNAISWSIRID